MQQQNPTALNMSVAWMKNMDIERVLTKIHDPFKDLDRTLTGL